MTSRPTSPALRERPSFVTSGTYKKEHFFRAADRVQVLPRGLLTVTRDYRWQLEAWAVFSNHYHFVAHLPQHEDSAESLSAMLGLLHEKTSKWINRLDDSAISLQSFHPG